MVENYFDLMIVCEIDVDYGFQVFMEFFFGSQKENWLVKVVLIFVNIVQFLILMFQCCWDFGVLLCKVIEFYLMDEKIVVFGIGGLFYQL